MAPRVAANVMPGRDRARQEGNEVNTFFAVCVTVASHERRVLSAINTEITQFRQFDFWLRPGDRSFFVAGCGGARYAVLSSA